MRNMLLAVFLTMAAVTAALGTAAAMDGFDLGDMPPLPPPLLEDTDDAPAPPPLTPPGAAKAPAAPGLAPMAPPPFSEPGAPQSGDDAGMDFASPLPPAPPPVQPALGSAGAAASPLAPPLAGSVAPVGLPVVPAGQPAPGGASAAAPVAETPVPARIEGGRVNVRAGPNTQYESIAVLTTGTSITILAKHGDWYKIVFPADQLASIHKSMVSADITGEIPETGLPGVVNQDNANVHAFYWDKSTVVGTLPKGTPVIIRQERGQWYRITPPETARAYVFGTYVRIDGNQMVAADAAPAPVNPAVDLTQSSGDGTRGAVKMSKDQERVIELKESYYKRMQERYDAEMEAEEAAAKAATEAKRQQASQLDSALQDLESRLGAIDQETNERISTVYQQFLPQPTLLSGVSAAEWAPPDPAGGGYTGWVEYIGRVGGAPTPYRLTKGGEIRFYLVSNQYNLDSAAGRRVWVNGPLQFVGGASANVLQVEQMRILTEMEIAGDLQAQTAVRQAGQYAPQAAGDAMPPTQSSPQPSVFDFSNAGTVIEYGPEGGPLDASAGYGSAPQMPVYEAAPQFSTPAGQDPFSGFGPEYGQPLPAAPAGAPVFSTAPGEVMIYSGTGPLPEMLRAPAQIPVGPSDPSQLPDVVGAGMPAPTYYDTSAPLDLGVGGFQGEVDSDSYEQPIINEIAPQ